MRYSIRLLSTVAIVGLAVGSVSCQKWLSSGVATGAARLTVRNVAAMLSIVSDDTNCGFASNAVLQSPTVDGQVGGTGTVTWKVTDCTIQMSELQEVSRDCSDVTTYASGTLTLSATKIIHGHITGNPFSPVVPSASDSATLVLTSAEFSDFIVTKSNSENVLTMKSGTVSAVMQPRLAVSATQGACAIVTPNAAFTDIVYQDADLQVQTPSREFDVQVSTSNISAENGIHSEQENAIRGTLTVWGQEETVPAFGDGGGLDPDYQGGAFKESYGCTEDLLKPVSFNCDLQPIMAEGVARLSIRNLGILGSVINADSNCGFESPTVQMNATFDGVTGYDGGSITFDLGGGCLVSFPEDTLVSTDCNGVETYVRGTAHVTGSKRITGYLTGDPLAPIVPTSRDPAVIMLQAQLTGFEVWTSASNKSLIVQHGRLSGRIEPRTALDLATGACSLPTAISDFSSVRLDNARVRLSSDSNHFDMTVDTADLNALNGFKGARENYLGGTISIGGRSVEIPLESKAPVLDPDYQRSLFQNGYTCTPNMAVPINEEQCSFRDTLAQAAARLLIKSVGTVIKTVDEDTDCGLGSLGGMIPSSINGFLYEKGSMTWEIDACTVGDPHPIQVAQYCDGKTTHIAGTATVTATKTVNGELVIGYPPILPRDRESVDIQIHEISFTDFFAYDLAPGATDPEAALEIHSGRVSGSLNPVTGESASKPNAYFIKTPVTAFHNIRALNLDATLRVGAKRFNFILNGSDLEAFNGSFRYETNVLGGSLSLDGKTVAVPVNPTDPTLDPAYEQAAFDASYSCKEDLAEPVPSASNATGP